MAGRSYQTSSQTPSEQWAQEKSGKGASLATRRLRPLLVLASGNLSGPWHYCAATLCGCKEATGSQELRIPWIGLDAPVEDQVIPADAGHAQRAVVQRGAVADLEHVAVAGQRQEHVARVAADGRKVDVRQIAHGKRAVVSHAGPAELRDDPQGIGGATVHPEVDVGAVAVLNEAQLARLPATVAVDVIPEAEARQQAVRLVRVDHHVAGVGARRILPQRRHSALGAVQALGRHP